MLPPGGEDERFRWGLSPEALYIIEHRDMRTALMAGGTSTITRMKRRNCTTKKNSKKKGGYTKEKWEGGDPDLPAVLRPQISVCDGGGGATLMVLYRGLGLGLSCDCV